MITRILSKKAQGTRHKVQVLASCTLRPGMCLVLCALCLFISCSNKKETPKDILPVQKFTSVMYDLSRADQYVADYVLRDTARNKKMESIRMYEAIFQVHKTTQAQFKKSMDYYSADPLVFRPIIDSLAAMKKSINTGSSFPFKRDSIIKNIQSVQ